MTSTYNDEAGGDEINDYLYETTSRTSHYASWILLTQFGTVAFQCYSPMTPWPRLPSAKNQWVFEHY